jgi:hypothetical protein
LGYIVIIAEVVLVENFVHQFASFTTESLFFKMNSCFLAWFTAMVAMDAGGSLFLIGLGGDHKVKSSG